MRKDVPCLVAVWEGAQGGQTPGFVEGVETLRVRQTWEWLRGGFSGSTVPCLKMGEGGLKRWALDRLSWRGF